jgi:hypothetical protein
VTKAKAAQAQSSVPRRRRTLSRPCETDCPKALPSAPTGDAPTPVRPQKPRRNAESASNASEIR